MENEEVVVPETTEEVTPEVTPEETQTEKAQKEERQEMDWKAEFEKQKEIADNQKIRAEKAEKKAREVSKETKEPKPESSRSELSLKEQMALINAKVHEDDLEEVLDYAKYKKISVSEALKSNVIKASLAEKEELRNTAEATNTGRTRSGNSKQSGDVLLNKAKKTGELPDRDEDLETLLEARYTKKK